MKTNYILIKGAGDLASAVAVRLYNAGYRLIMTDIAKPTAVRRTVSFSEAVYAKSCIVENIEAIQTDIENYQSILQQNAIPVLVDISPEDIERINPIVVIDAIIAKKNLGTYKNPNYYTIALGPGFNAPDDVDVVIETMRGHNLGRCIYNGSAIKNTGIPGEVMGYTTQRVLRAKEEGSLEFTKKIGDYVVENEHIGYILSHSNKIPIVANISGIIRGLIHHSCLVTKGLKIGDIDPRTDPFHCHTVSDKGLSLGGAVLEALLKAKIFPVML